MNKVVLVGRLTAKPELRYTASNTAYTRFSIAVNRPFANNIILPLDVNILLYCSHNLSNGIITSQAFAVVP